MKKKDKEKEKEKRKKNGKRAKKKIELIQLESRAQSERNLMPSTIRQLVGNH